MHRRTLFSLVGGLFLAGCEAPPEPPHSPEPGPDPRAAGAFDERSAGTVAGQVRWSGPVPAVPPYHAPISPLSEQSGSAWRDWPNPHAPRIDPASGGVAGAVVFLRGVEPARARPWDLPPVRVEVDDYRCRVLQGEAADWCGVVRRGDAVEIESKQAVFHSLQARGAAFFTLTLPDPGRKRARRLERAGVVELASGTGCFWMRGWLFVDDHPYYAVTDAQGRFTLPKVPPGKCELVCWHPNWHEADRELDADTCAIFRMTYRPPLEVVQSAEVGRGATRTALFTLSAEQFAP